MTRFESLVADGRAALAEAAARRAAERLSAALELWRGRPLAELSDEGALRAEAERLEELRLLALEDRLAADLALGRSGELVDELEALVAEHPYRERLWQELMLALYHAGRQADALAAYKRARSVLDEQLGLEPSERLRKLEQAILRHEVERVEPPEERHNLPAERTSFVGRQAELAELDDLLATARKTPRSEPRSRSPRRWRAPPLAGSGVGAPFELGVINGADAATVLKGTTQDAQLRIISVSR